MGIVLPITAADCSSSRSRSGRRLIRARSTSSTVSGTVISSDGPPCSRTVRASSSRKRGLPSALLTIRSHTGSARRSRGRNPPSTLRLSSGESGWSATWVSRDRSSDWGQYPGRYVTISISGAPSRVFTISARASEEASSQWMSSSAMTSGRRRLASMHIWRRIWVVRTWMPSIRDVSSASVPSLIPRKRSR